MPLPDVAEKWTSKIVEVTLGEEPNQITIGGHTTLPCLNFEGEIRLPPEIEEGLYRIAQEALNNVLKHAQAHSITVSLRHVAHQRIVVLEIADDGLGFDPAVARDQGGMGLRGMEERAAQFGGQLTIQSRPGAGTSVRVEVYQ